MARLWRSVDARLGRRAHRGGRVSARLRFVGGPAIRLGGRAIRLGGLAIRLGGLAILLGGLALPTTALANAFTEVQQVYLQSGTGQIPDCQFSSSELEAAEKLAPDYSYQYDSAFTDAIGAALAARADGDCDTKRSPDAASKRLLGPGTHPRSANLPLPASLTAAGSGGLPPVLLVAFILVGALMLSLAGWVGFNALGYEPRILQSARHSLREAEHRIGAGWTDLADRLRR